MNTLTLGPVELRPIKSSELELVRNWRNSPDVAPYMYNEDKISEEQQIKWFEKISKDTLSTYWMICYESAPMGVANLAAIDNRNKKCDWAFYLGSPDARGKGIGSKVEILVLDYVFNQLNFNKLCCEVFTSNEGVIKQHQKFGFMIEGTRRKHILKNQEKFDIVEMAILNEEWQATRSTFIEKALK